MSKDVSIAEFENFGNLVTGRIITHEGDVMVVYSRNPYGSHNLVLVKEDQESNNNWENLSFRHGNAQCLEFIGIWMSERVWRKTVKFLAGRGLIYTRDRLNS